MIQKINIISIKEDLQRYIRVLRIFASNNKFEETTIELIEETIDKAKMIDDKKSLVDLIELKISQIEHLNDSINQISEMMMLMRNLSLEINYSDGLALSYNIEWYIEKIKGNKSKSKRALDFSIKIISDCKEYVEYSYFVCYYSYAVELWLEENNPQSSSILEKCVDFFRKKGFFRSLVQALSILFIIYQETQNGKSALKTTQNLLSSKIPFDSLPRDIQAYSYYFIGLSHKLQLNLLLAEKYLEKARKIFKEKLEKSIYSFYYIHVLSNLSTILALQGKMEQALELIKEVENLLQTGYLSKYFDPTSKRQITHSFNLVNFYVKSRVYGKTNELTKLINDIYKNSKVNYSNAVMLTEFLLNANLNIEQLMELKNTNNNSLERVRHIIGFLIEKTKINTEINKDQNNLNCIKTIQQRFKTNKMTFIEKTYADLLIAQQLFSLKRFAEIHPLLKRYEKQLHRIEVLELRIFMEAFIQVGAYNSGDPLAPALQYMAIKKCRTHGFSRLENILLDYLQMLKQDALRLML